MKMSPYQNWLRLLAKARFMTISDLARRSGYSQPDVSRSLSASHAWSLDRIEAYARALSIPVHELLNPRSSLEDAFGVIFQPIIEAALARDRNPGLTIPIWRA